MDDRMANACSWYLHSIKNKLVLENEIKIGQSLKPEICVCVDVPVRDGAKVLPYPVHGAAEDVNVVEDGKENLRKKYQGLEFSRNWSWRLFSPTITRILLKMLLSRLEMRTGMARQLPRIPVHPRIICP